MRRKARRFRRLCGRALRPAVSLLVLGGMFACAPARPAPPAGSLGHPRVEYGVASWYGKDFHGRLTASGEVYNMFALTAAHREAPLGVQALVTNLSNGRTVRVRINDRGPFVEGRLLDLSYEAARRLDMLEAGLARVRVEFLPATAPKPAFVVQAGAYQHHGRAVRVQQTLAAYYPRVWIAPVRYERRLLYRVQLGVFDERRAAEQAARRVRALGYEAGIIPLLAATP